MTEYTRRFEQGCVYAHFIAKDENEKVNHYLRGVNPIIRRDIHLTSASTFRGVVDKALEAEQDELDVRQWRSPPSISPQPWKKANTAQQKGKQLAKPTAPELKPTCPKCQKNHYGPCAIRTNKCYRCQKPGHMAKDCLQPPAATPGRVFAMTQEQANEDPLMITGIMHINSLPVYTLIDSGSTHSFITRSIVAKLRLEPRRIDSPFSISIPSGELLSSNLYLSSCPLQIQHQILEIDLIILPIDHFDIILGMDWLTKYKAQIHCAQKSVQLSLPNGQTLHFPETRLPTPQIISACKAIKLIKKGHLYQLIDIVNPHNTPDIHSVPIVSSYPDVFPDDLPGLSPDREIEFEINLKPGSAHVSKTPYRMAPLELRELKTQIQE